MYTWVNRLGKVFMPFTRLMNFLSPLVDFMARLWVASIVFDAGWDKIVHWQHTSVIFSALLSPTVHLGYLFAYVAIFCELLFALLLIIGLGGRVIIFLFFLYNLVAWLVFPHFWVPEGAVSATLQTCWTFLLLMLLAHGSGKWSLDYWLRKRYERQTEKEAMEHIKQVNAKMKMR